MTKVSPASRAALALLLLAGAGYLVGTYTSPHVNRYNERIAIGGVPVSDAQIVAAFEQVEAARDDVPLTYFEYGTLAAIAVFAATNLDVWILEVGMGGRLDACNAIDPSASLITGSISSQLGRKTQPPWGVVQGKTC